MGGWFHKHLLVLTSYKEVLVTRLNVPLTPCPS